MSMQMFLYTDGYDNLKIYMAHKFKSVLLPKHHLFSHVLKPNANMRNIFEYAKVGMRFEN